MIYDLHIHTDKSACSSMRPMQLLNAAIKKRLDGIAITDHNEISGALEVKRLNKDKRLKIIVGEEVSTEYGHVLCYFLKKKIPKGSFKNVLEAAAKQNAIIAIAHPYDFFRKNANIKVIKRFASRIHAIETVNGRCLNPIFNDLAHRLAMKLGLAEIGGSDGHFPYEIGGAMTRFSDQLRTAILEHTTHPEGSTIRGLFGLAHTALHAAYAQIKH